eukprot:1146279-Pelagomonas_calceolata.AAC.2
MCALRWQEISAAKVGSCYCLARLATLMVVWRGLLSGPDQEGVAGIGQWQGDGGVEVGKGKGSYSGRAEGVGRPAAREV